MCMIYIHTYVHMWKHILIFLYIWPNLFDSISELWTKRTKLILEEFLPLLLIGDSVCSPIHRRSFASLSMGLPLTQRCSCSASADLRAIAPTSKWGKCRLWTWLLDVNCWIDQAVSEHTFSAIQSDRLSTCVDPSFNKFNFKNNDETNEFSFLPKWAEFKFHPF